ncbi:MAG TPA: cell division ATP-binding protein FtsE [Desulfobulbus sp.]|nr:cell division ATP-binding protein FtsE [Desulfobulbus sp.]
MTETTPEVMVDLIKVSKTYPPSVHALVDVSLSVRRGEMLFLTGMSGAGKTTLLRLLCRSETPDKGLVEVAGMDLDRISGSALQRLRRRIGMAYQDFKLLPRHTVAGNIALAMEVAYRKPTFIRKRTRELLEKLRLADKHDTPAGELSRGEQQRISIARALANMPDLVLADEPTGNLDRETTTLVMELFREHEERGATIIIATHDRELFSHGTDRVVELRAGRLLAPGEEPEKEGESAATVKEEAAR